MRLSGRSRWVQQSWISHMCLRHSKDPSSPDRSVLLHLRTFHSKPVFVACFSFFLSFVLLACLLCRTIPHTRTGTAKPRRLTERSLCRTDNVTSALFLSSPQDIQITGILSSKANLYLFFFFLAHKVRELVVIGILQV